jgi:phosphatidylethanolamine/phosphatidyl-N-methylethanolamine N-methyltransferase
MAVTDALFFLRTWMRDPRQIGAVVPSGPALARLITANIDHRTGPVIELGPGTGVFTRALLARGVPRHRLALVEADHGFADALTRRYPDVHVLRMDAAQLGQTQPLFDNEGASTIVSGLPMLSMPAQQVAAIVHGAFERQLRQDGAFYQFTYGLRCPLPRELLQRLGLEAHRVGRTWWNLPPASVYRIGRSPTSVAA